MFGLGLSGILRSATVLAVIGVLAWGGRALWQAGYAAAERDRAEAVEALQDRLDAVTAATMQDVAEALQWRRDLTARERRLILDAMQDPDADRRALGAGSVQRLDQIR